MEQVAPFLLKNKQPFFLRDYSLSIFLSLKKPVRMEQNTDAMTPLEQKEIRGITIKNLWGLIATAATIIFFVWGIMAGYAEKTDGQFKQINDRLLRMETARPEDVKLNETRINFLQLQIDQMKVQINEMDKRYK